MGMCSRGVVRAAKVLRVRVKVPRMLHRSLRSQRRVRRWIMVCVRLMSMSRDRDLAVKPRSVRCSRQASPSLRLLMLHLFRTMDAGRPKGVEYSVDFATLCVEEDFTRWHVIPAPFANCAGVRG